MKLNADKLKQLAEGAGLTVDQLAEAVERTGLDGARAQKAVTNWMAGRDHPRCKAGDIARLADALDVSPKDLASFVSKIEFHRGGTRKARLVADLVRGRQVDEALEILTFSKKRAAVNVKKALDAAVADAEQFEADRSELYVSESRVDEGPHIKRFRPKDRGRAHPILKRTSHITVGVEERN